MDIVKVPFVIARKQRRLRDIMLNVIQKPDALLMSKRLIKNPLKEFGKRNKVNVVGFFTRFRLRYIGGARNTSVTSVVYTLVSGEVD